MPTVHRKQPTETSCAQACLAMIFDIPVADVLVHLPSRRGGTKHKAMIKFLQDRGIKCDSRLTNARHKPLPEVGLVRITWPNNKAHIVLKVGRTWHDPMLAGFFTGVPNPPLSWASDGRITSFLALHPEDLR